MADQPATADVRVGARVRLPLRFRVGRLEGVFLDVHRPLISAPSESGKEALPRDAASTCTLRAAEIVPAITPAAIAEAGRCIRPTVMPAKAGIHAAVGAAEA
jgi:hypothetical protein